jgi:hypothetical protein
MERPLIRRKPPYPWDVKAHARDPTSGNSNAANRAPLSIRPGQQVRRDAAPERKIIQQYIENK